MARFDATDAVLADVQAKAAAAVFAAGAAVVAAELAVAKSVINQETILANQRTIQKILERQPTICRFREL